jgi:hypothetical protein
MNRYCKTLLVMGMTFAGLPVCSAATVKNGAEDPAVTKADREVFAALSKGDKAAANKWLDPDFSWIDAQGVMWAKDDAFRAGIKPLISAPPPESGMVVHSYGKVVFIQWKDGNNFSGHFWVKRPGGWKLLHANELTAQKRDFKVVEPTYDIPCNNPCKAVPYKPIGEGEKAALAEWQDQESGQARWEVRVADDLDQRAVNTWGGASGSKAERIAGMNKRAAANPNAPKVGAAPALWIRTWDFGDAVVMVSVQPTYGDKPYWSSRVLAKNETGLWQMMESYHNYILAAPVMTATPNQPDLK